MGDDATRERIEYGECSTLELAAQLQIQAESMDWDRARHTAMQRAQALLQADSKAAGRQLKARERRDESSRYTPTRGYPPRLGYELPLLAARLGGRRRAIAETRRPPARPPAALPNPARPDRARARARRVDASMVARVKRYEVVSARTMAVELRDYADRLERRIVAVRQAADALDPPRRRRRKKPARSVDGR